MLASLHIFIHHSAMRRFLPAFLFAVVLLAFNCYFLWEWRADQISGDALIHLVFARNFAEGHWFEYAIGQPSRANTTILWEWILALLGSVTGLIKSQEGFLSVARLFAICCVIVSGWRVYAWSRFMQLSSSVSALLSVLLMLNPVTFYWTAVNPMETCMTLVLTLLTAEWVWRNARSFPEHRKELCWHGCGGGLLIFSLSLIRPELLTVAPIAALSFLLGHGKRSWPLAAAVLVVPLALTALQALLLYWNGIPVIPTPTLARRMIALTYDTRPLPLFGIPYNPDPWKVMAAMGPLMALSTWLACRGTSCEKTVHFFILGVFGFSACFFSFYYYTTWQGRYMLPSILVLVPPSIAFLALRLPKSIGWSAGPVYALTLCALALYPLARYAQAPTERAKSVHFVQPPPGTKRILVQEVQSAYFYPQLYHISTEGLITLEAYAAYKKDLSVYEFIFEQKPDLVAFGRYYLRDPEGLQKQINESAKIGRDLDCKKIHLKFLGEMAGCGPIFQASYDE